MTEPTVWVVQDNNYSIRSADKYGTLRFITQHDLSNMSGSRSELLVSGDIRKFATEYKNGIDYILVVGNPIVIGMVFAAIERWYPALRHKILKWDARDKVYYDYEVDLSLLV